MYALTLKSRDVVASSRIRRLEPLVVESQSRPDHAKVISSQAISVGGDITHDGVESPLRLRRVHLEIAGDEKIVRRPGEVIILLHDEEPVFGEGLAVPQIALIDTGA